MTVPDKYYGEQNLRLAQALLEKQGEINRLRAIIDRSRAALAAFEGRGVNNFDIPTPGEVRDAWRDSLTEPAQQGDTDGG